MMDKENFLMNPEIQQSMAMLMGGDKKETKQLSEEQKKQIIKKYVNMFYSLAAINWCNGTTLGVAWQKALNQMDEFVKSKTKVLNHPMNPYLVAVHAKYKRHISETLLTNKHVNEKLNMSKELKEEWKRFASANVGKDMEFFNNLHKEFMPEQNITKLPVAEPFKKAQDKALSKMQQLIFLQQMRERRAA